MLHGASISRLPRPRTGGLRVGREAEDRRRCIINEPTAASLTYGLNKEHDQAILMFDLGGSKRARRR